MAMRSSKRALRYGRRGQNSSNSQSAYEPTEDPAKAKPIRHVEAPQRVVGSPRSKAKCAACNDNCASDIQLDQYYTREDIAALLYGVVGMYFDLTLYQIVEPSAGAGSFFKIMPFGSWAYDVEPKYPGIETADFLKVKFECDRPVAVIGNPPFGKSASMAKRFFNHAASQADVIAFIVPKSFRKASIENRLDQFFHLVREEAVPDDAFIFRSKPYSVPAVFQIWERRAEPRKLQFAETRHPDFQFTTPDLADFAIQRIGQRAGRVHRDLTASPRSHYFIKGDVEAVMRELDFASVVGNAAGNPSLAKSEIISLYRTWVEA